MKYWLLFGLCALLVTSPTQAGNQKEERLAASVRAALHAAVSDAPPTIAIGNSADRDRWLSEMSQRLEKRVLRNPNAYKELRTPEARKELLITIHYEATRAGLDPQLVLGLIQVESRFRKYAVSKAGARGYMQVMPFWVKTIGNHEDNLFHMRTNLRYGCTILRHYLDLEKGNLFLALGRYNGSRGKSTYPDLVNTAWQKQWTWAPSETPVQVAALSPSPPPPPAPTPPATPVPAIEPPPAVLPQQTTAPLPAPEQPPVADPPPPTQTASRVPVRRDIVIVR
jgi:soluble lytic murein transglycosylase-like protein